MKNWIWASLIISLVAFGYIENKSTEVLTKTRLKKLYNIACKHEANFCMMMSSLSGQMSQEQASMVCAQLFQKCVSEADAYLEYVEQ